MEQLSFIDDPRPIAIVNVAMKSTHHAETTELLIGRNLDWAR